MFISFYKCFACKDVPCVHLVLFRDQKSESDPLEPELRMVMSFYVDAENWG